MQHLHYYYYCSSSSTNPPPPSLSHHHRLPIINPLLLTSPLSSRLLLPPLSSSSSSSSDAVSLPYSVPRPAIDSVPGKKSDEEEDMERIGIDERLEEIARKLPMFGPASWKEGEGEGEGEEGERKRPLDVNLDLALYRAKVLGRKSKFDEAERILRNYCIYYWPEDGRAYVALGKLLRKQLRTAEARTVYEKGCQATQGENPFIWQCWADLENKLGNMRKARELFDAGTVADKSHIASWHGWAVMELKQGNVKKARSLLGKALKYCRGNEYIYQTLACLEAKAGRYEQARFLFRRAINFNPKSCASWLGWAQLEIQQENNCAARKLFEELYPAAPLSLLQRAVQASPKNRYAWQVWGLFEANLGNIEAARKLMKIGHLLNPMDPVILQSLALLEYKHSTANLARLLFKCASEVDPQHQPIWFAWGWMEWKEGNLDTARKLYRRVLAIDSTSETTARCLQAWGVLEQRAGNLSAARQLFRSSLSVNSQSYVTWMTWASLEEDRGNSARAEEIRDLYFQQRTEVVDDATWVMGLLDIIDPALVRLKQLLNLDQGASTENLDQLQYSLQKEGNGTYEDSIGSLSTGFRDDSNFNLVTFIEKKLSLDISKLDDLMEASLMSIAETKGSRKPWRRKRETTQQQQGEELQ